MATSHGASKVFPHPLGTIRSTAHNRHTGGAMRCPSPQPSYRRRPVSRGVGVGVRQWWFQCHTSHRLVSRSMDSENGNPSAHSAVSTLSMENPLAHFPVFNKPAPAGGQIQRRADKDPHRMHRISRSSERKCQKMSGYVRTNRTPTPSAPSAVNPPHYATPSTPGVKKCQEMSGYFGGLVLQSPPSNHSCHKREANVARSSRHLPTAFAWEGNGACMEPGIS